MEKSRIVICETYVLYLDIPAVIASEATTGLAKEGQLS